MRVHSGSCGSMRVHARPCRSMRVHAIPVHAGPRESMRVHARSMFVLSQLFPGLLTTEQAQEAIAERLAFAALGDPILNRRTETYKKGSKFYSYSRWVVLSSKHHPLISLLLLLAHVVTPLLAHMMPTTAIACVVSTLPCPLTCKCQTLSYAWSCVMVTGWSALVQSHADHMHTHVLTHWWWSQGGLHTQWSCRGLHGGSHVEVLRSHVIACMCDCHVVGGMCV